MEENKNILQSIITSEDIIEEILQHLPMKALARFKALSKKWRSTIESTHFSHKRLLRSGLPTPNMKLLVVHQPSSNPNDDSNSTTFLLDTFSGDHDNNGEISLTSSTSYTLLDDTIDDQDKTIQVLGSCDGLVLVQVYKDFRYIYLINPTTREHRTLSPEPSQWSNHVSYTTTKTNPVTGENFLHQSCN
ncbi:unnamed protein product [Arabis nemorensis]|uniref:F-box domain-containing protein n=1 Tax=Arabis nemorensis TaxID=586526 RepID=A0A565BZ55_9BRAS|nr:unnamed protein product [Arabis nemorensis]